MRPSHWQERRSRRQPLLAFPSGPERACDRTWPGLSPDWHPGWLPSAAWEYRWLPGKHSSRAYSAARNRELSPGFHLRIGCPVPRPVLRYTPGIAPAAPRSANLRTVASPIPIAPPVTATTLSLKLMLI